MTTKFLIKTILVFALVVAVFKGVPQKTWTWLQGSSVNSKIQSLINGQDNLSGLLKGPLDNAAHANLTNVGIIEWTNVQRANQGLHPLQDNALLRKAAENKLADMFKQQYFEHESPDGKMPSDIIKSTGYEYVVVGENLALGNFKTDEVLVQAWMDSPGHRANILNKKYQEIGTAAGKGIYEGKEIWLAVQEFGTPLDSCPSTSTGKKSQIESGRIELTKLQTELQQKKSEIDANRYSSQEEYSKAVDYYNALVQRSNQLSAKIQKLVQQYNASVNAFNDCLESDK